MAKATERSETINVLPISMDHIDLCVIGLSPLIFNSMSAKALQTLLKPGRRSKTEADRAGTLKHIPIDEFRESVNLDDRPEALTRLCLPAPAIKGALMTAALDLPGTRKSEIGRLAWVEGYRIPVWGDPLLMMAVVRMADIGRTPDVRSRAILPVWASKFRVSFVKPKLTAQAIIALLTAGGVTCGVGDFRQEKGKGSFGQFRICQEDDAEWRAITKASTKKTQDAALAKAEPYDALSARLLTWFAGEVAKGEPAPAAEKAGRKRRGNGAATIPADLLAESEPDARRAARS